MKKFTTFAILIFFLLMQHRLMSQTTMNLYENVPNKIDNPKYIEKVVSGNDMITRISKVSVPTMTVFSPDPSINQHTAVIICPGGGYQILAYDHEGTIIAKILNDWGITAIVLKYRLPSDSIMIDKTIGPLQDAQRAIQLTRENAKKWQIDTSKIGIMGFSAGGHLAASASTRFEKAFIDNPDHINLRPDFSILAYPVISFQAAITHSGSRQSLVGRNPSAELVDLNSNELQVSQKTPPAFLVLAGDDKTVNPENSIKYYEALLHFHIPAELHIYQNGGHGFGATDKATKDDWMQSLKYWLEHNHIIKTN